MMIITHFSFGQESVLITTRLDTLTGKVLINFGDQYNNDVASIKIDKKKKKFQAYEVRSIALEDSTILHPIKMDGRYQFVKLIQDGSFLKLYGYNEPAGINGGFGLQVLVKATGSNHKIGNIGFKKRIIDFLTECTDVTAKIENGDYSKKDISKIINGYNSCINSKSNASKKEVMAELEASKIDGLITTVTNSPKIADKEELLDMLKDVKSKMASQKDIPSYLQSAIIGKFENDKELIKQFKSIIENK